MHIYDKESASSTGQGADDVAAPVNVQLLLINIQLIDHEDSRVQEGVKSLRNSFGSVIAEGARQVLSILRDTLWNI